MAKTSASEPKSKAQTQMQNLTTPQQAQRPNASPYPTTSLHQRTPKQRGDHTPEAHDLAIQNAIDEQLLRELNATIPLEFQDADEEEDDDEKTVPEAESSALQVAEVQARRILEAEMRTPPVVGLGKDWRKGKRK